MLGRKVHFLLEGVTETLDVVEAALHTDGADIGLTTLEELDGLEDAVLVDEVDAGHACHGFYLPVERGVAHA